MDTPPPIPKLPFARPAAARQRRLIEREIEQAVLRHDQVVDCAVVLQGRSPGDIPSGVCASCGIPDDYPGIGIDEAGVCSLCELYTGNQTSIGSYFRAEPDFEALVRRRAGDAEYDCLLLFSGGKDSTYVLHQLVELGLRVMTFTFDNGFISQTALQNVDSITAALGIEHVTAKRRDQNKIFFQSLTEHKSVCNGCFRSLLELSTRLAQERGIPSIITGLSRGQIIDERLSWFYQQGVFDAEEIERELAVGRQIYHQAGAPRQNLELSRVEVIDYYRYSDVTKNDIREFLVSQSALWAQPTDTGFCSSNCLINDVGVYVHNMERGFHNYESPTRWEVRLGHLDKAEADLELQAPVNVTRVQKMLAGIGYPDPADHKELGKRLVVYYVSLGEVGQAELRATLTHNVPDFLFPDHWIRMEAIPRNAGALSVRDLPPLTGPASRFDLAAPEPLTTDPTLPLTHAQQSILDRGRVDLSTRSRAILVELPDVADAERIKRVGLNLLLTHDALRLRFENTDGGWRQRDGGIGGAVPVLGLDLTSHTPDRHPALLRAAVRRLRSRLDIHNGPVVQFALVTSGSDRDRLLLVVHELVADVRSLRLLLSDLAAEYRLPGSAPGGDSFASAVPGPPWPGSDSPSGMSLPDGEPGEPTTCRTSAPTDPPPDAIRSTISTALAEWLGAPVALDFVDHTTSDPALPIGQFTDGFSPGTQVRVNYFGELTDLVAGTPFTLDEVDTVDPTALPEIAPYLLEINVYRWDGRLHLNWHCASSLNQLLTDAGLPQLIANAVR